MNQGILCTRCDKFVSEAVKCELAGCEHHNYQPAMREHFRGVMPAKYSYSLIGGANAGKTCYLIALVDALLNPDPATANLMARYGIAEFGIIDPDSQNYYDDLLARYRSGRLPGTVKDLPLGYFNVILRMDGGVSYELALFNSSGEMIQDHYKGNSRSASHEMKGSALLCFLDPRADSGLEELLLDRSAHACENFAFPAHIYKIMQQVNRGTLIVKNPLAVCISKFDLLLHLRPKDLPQFPYVLPDSKNFFDEIRNVSEQLKPFIQAHSKTVDPANLEKKFSSLSLFALAPFGKADDPPFWGNRSPQGIIAPFFWILKEQNIIKDIYGNY